MQESERREGTAMGKASFAYVIPEYENTEPIHLALWGLALSPWLAGGRVWRVHEWEILHSLWKRCSCSCWVVIPRIFQCHWSRWKVRQQDGNVAKKSELGRRPSFPCLFVAGTLSSLPFGFRICSPPGSGYVSNWIVSQWAKAGQFSRLLAYWYTIYVQPVALSNKN